MPCNIEKCLGHGAYGVVYLLQVKNYHKVALKVTRLRDQPTSNTKPEAEADLLQKLCHPHLTQCVGQFLEKNTLYIFTEYCKHGSLKVYIDKRRKQAKHIEEKSVLKWTNQMADALRYLHDRKIIHRDLKTDNVFLHDGGNVKIGDLGVARELAYTNEPVGTLAGTFPYMCHEMLDGKLYTTKADMWSLGCCVHEMMTLQTTFPSSLVDLIRMQSQGEVPPMPDMYTAELQYIVLLLLSKEPSKRLDALEVLYYISRITKTKFSACDLTEFPALEVTIELKKEIIQEVENFLPSIETDSDCTYDGTLLTSVQTRKTDSDSTYDGTLLPSVQTRKTDIGSTYDGTLLTSVQTRNSRMQLEEIKAKNFMSLVHQIEFIDHTQLTEEAREWLCYNSYYENGVGTLLPEQCHSLESSVTLYTRAQNVKFQLRKKKATKDPSEDLSPEMMKVAKNIIRLYQHEDESFLQMMLVSAIGSRNFSLHGNALIEKVKFEKILL